MHNSYWLHQTSRSSFGYCSLYSSLKMLGLIHALTYCFCTVECLLLYFILFKLEYALPAWNIMTTNANKQECSLSLRHFFLIFLTVMLLQLRTVQVTRHQFDALFFIIRVFPRSKFYPSMIDNSSLQVPSCNVRNFTQCSARQKLSFN